jgi:hypothetical protein
MGLKIKRATMADVASSLARIHDRISGVEEQVRNMVGPLNESLALERQRLMRERDYEHRVALGQLDAQRHAPDRVAKALEDVVAQLRGIQR